MSAFIIHFYLDYQNFMAICISFLCTLIICCQFRFQNQGHVWVLDLDTHQDRHSLPTQVQIVKLRHYFKTLSLSIKWVDEVIIEYAWCNAVQWWPGSVTGHTMDWCHTPGHCLGILLSWSLVHPHTRHL